MTQRILFTGGSGKAGRHVLPWLANRGYQILNFDLKPSGHAHIPTLLGDITDGSQVFNAMTSHFGFGGYELGHPPAPVDAVVHFAAIRPVDAAPDADAFQPAKEFTLHGVEYRTGWADGRPAFSERHAGQPADHYTAAFALGYKPLRQYIVPTGGGRYQAAELAFDPLKKEWFDVFGDERRQPGEWGHWRGRGMNWNSMCAACHLTDFKKNYDAATDTYASTWREHGAG